MDLSYVRRVLKWEYLILLLVMGLAYNFRVFGIFASHGLALAVSLMICLLIFLPVILPRYRPVPSFHWQTRRKLIGFSFTNNISEGLWNLPTWILPLIILNMIGAGIGWLATQTALVFFTVPQLVSKIRYPFAPDLTLKSIQE